MTLSSLAEKVDFIRKTRSENYRASMQLEGIKVVKVSKKSAATKEELIAKYKALA